MPVLEATEARLAYFGAHLLRDGDYFRFRTRRNFPLFEMAIGEHYLPNYIMERKKGLYLEFHNEPHYHEPLDAPSRGSYILAKEVGDAPAAGDGTARKFFDIASFRVPCGTAVYTEPGAIHDDATTIGRWRVGYINAQQFSTVTIRNAAGDLVGFEFDADADANTDANEC